MNPEKTTDLPEVIDNLSHDVVQMLHQVDIEKDGNGTSLVVIGTLWNVNQTTI